MSDDIVGSRVKQFQFYRALAIRPQGPLPPERATARLSAYVYGNILALASVIVASPASIEHGTAAILVAGTGATTFVAHIFAEFVAHTCVSPPDGHVPEERVHALAELRDAVPIASSAGLPSMVLALGWMGVLSAQWAFLLAGVLITIRIATVQIVTERLRGRPLTFRVFVAGLATAALAAMIVAAKFVVGH